MDDQPSSPIAEPESTPGRRPSFVVFLSGAVTLVGAVAGLALFLRAQLADPVQTPVDPSAILAAVQATPPVASGGGAAKPSGGRHIGKTYPLDTFVVNIQDRNRDRYLKLKTELELLEPDTADEIEQRLPQIRDLIISLLSSKSFEDIRTIEGKNFLREEILLRVNSLLVTGSVKRIFFTEFVVQ